MGWGGSNWKHKNWLWRSKTICICRSYDDMSGKHQRIKEKKTATKNKKINKEKRGEYKNNLQKSITFLKTNAMFKDIIEKLT